MSWTLTRNAIAAALHAAFEHVAHVEFATDLLEVDRLALVGEGSVARDDKRAANARQIGGQALGHAVDEIFLFRIAADIGERQDDNRETRWPRIVVEVCDGEWASPAPAWPTSSE